MTPRAALASWYVVVHNPGPMSDAYEVAGDPQHSGPFVFSCEHASNALPLGIVASETDQLLLDDHWGWDIGARDLTLALVQRLGGQAILSTYSRLVADPNRDPRDPAYIVREVDGQPLSFNEDVADAEHARRTAKLFDPYHKAIGDTLTARRAMGPHVHLLAIHSFTPLFLGRPRPMEVGVLFDRFDEDAWRLDLALDAQGFESALNAPYSGKPPDRLIYSAHRHGDAHEIKYLELEIRQDLIDTPDKADAVASRIGAALDSFLPS